MASDVTVSFKARTSDLQKGIGSIKGELNGLKSSIGTTAAAMGAVYAGVKGFQFLADAIMDASKVAADFETLSVSLEVLTGSADKAADLFGKLKKLGAETPLELDDLAKATQTLMAFGVATEDVVPTLKMLGDIGMGDAEKLKGLALVFGQVSANGKLMGGDVLQMVNQGFNPLINISKRLNLTMVETRKKMEEGGISVDMVKQALKDATSNGGQFEGMMARIAQTTQGKLSNLSDTIASLKVAFGTGFNDGLKVALDAVNTGLPKITGLFENTGTYIGKAISESIDGDKEKFGKIGAYMGDLIGIGFKASLMAFANTVLPELMRGAFKLSNVLTGGKAVSDDDMEIFDKFVNQNKRANYAMTFESALKEAQFSAKDIFADDFKIIEKEKQEKRREQSYKDFVKTPFGKAFTSPVAKSFVPTSNAKDSPFKDPLIDLTKRTNTLLQEMANKKNNNGLVGWQ